jgi:hypothetical protein
MKINRLKDISSVFDIKNRLLIKKDILHELLDGLDRIKEFVAV